MKNFARVLIALSIALFLAPVSRAATAPISDRYGLCIDSPRTDVTVRLYAPVDTIFAVLFHNDRPIAQFRIDTMPGEGLRGLEHLAEADHDKWSSGAFYFHAGAPASHGDVIVVRNDRSDVYRNLFITVTWGAALPSWLDVRSLERSISHCGKNGSIESGAPPALADPMN